MMKKRLFWRLLGSYLFITTFVLIAALLFSSWALKEFYFRQIASNLESSANLVKIQLGTVFSDNNIDINKKCEVFGQSSGTRITLVDSSGNVLCDSDENSANMENHADRPEVKAAMAKKTGTAIRYSHTLNKEMVYVAVPAEDGKSVVSAVRTSMPLSSAGHALGTIYKKLLAGSVLIALVAAFLSFVLSRWIIYPIDEIRKGAQRFAKGKLDLRLEIYGADEISGLAVALNEMASQLDEKIQTITRQSNEQEAILASMIEGVIAVDTSQNIIIVNQAAKQMLGITLDVQGRSIQEVIRNTELQTLVSDTIKEKKNHESEISFEKENKKYMQVHCSNLKDVQGESIGAVAVFNDITKLKSLENMRRDFVANVSHELKTPITSIKGFVETLLDGALQSPDDTKRFLNIISKQVDQLNALLEDILLLSKTEQTSERTKLNTETCAVSDIIENALEVCGAAAASKDINIKLDCEKELKVNVNFPLISQALVNLLTNAINYSGPGNIVEIKSSKVDGEIKISVLDYGCGIKEEHIRRIFERFYRVDKARSRKLGGTGLGLAIVKHTVLAHNGRISVTSEPEKGSEFSIYIPD